MSCKPHVCLRVASSPLLRAVFARRLSATHCQTTIFPGYDWHPCVASKSGAFRYSLHQHSESSPKNGMIAANPRWVLYLGRLMVKGCDVRVRRKSCSAQHEPAGAAECD
jgi:hypothetical protein